MHCRLQAALSRGRWTRRRGALCSAGHPENAMNMSLRPILLPVLAAAALCACQQAARATPVAATDASAPVAAPAPTRATLAVGGSASLGDGRLRLLRVVSDSRCPEGAHCAWEGEVTLAFDFDDGSGRRGFELAQRRNPTATVGARSFTLKDYGPCRESKQKAVKECATVVLGGATTH
jgi:hypothetical protein